ncbi:MAG: hypothetical protein J6W35_07085 [Eubacterium sp.]|nr:hypothetical protein [Eubacterium sp.]
MSDKNLILGLSKKWGKFFTSEPDGANGTFVRVHDTKYTGTEFHFSEDGELIEYWAFEM